jgi:hypothetical protein
MDVLWSLPVDNSGDLLWIYFYIISSDNKPKVLRTFNAKLVFFEVNLETGILETAEDLFDMLLVFEFILRVDQNIVKVGSTEIVQVVEEDVVYIPLVGSWSIS